MSQVAVVMLVVLGQVPQLVALMWYTVEHGTLLVTGFQVNVSLIKLTALTGCETVRLKLEILSVMLSGGG